VSRPGDAVLHICLHVILMQSTQNHACNLQEVTIPPEQLERGRWVVPAAQGE
jgi:hypothetical protein